MIRVCVSGARGRMGRMLIDLVQAASDLTLASALERQGHPELGLELGSAHLTDDAGAAIEAADVLLDFALPEAVIEHLEPAVLHAKPVVTGTTGLGDDQQAAIDIAAKRIALVVASNMSRGIHLLSKLTALAAEALPGYDAEIFEIHHKNKVDSPSGTALQLAGILSEKQSYGRQAKRQTGEVGLSAARGGDVVGEHQVMFLGPGEQLILTHRATSREHFCQGALEAVRFAAGSAPGRYSMADVF